MRQELLKQLMWEDIQEIWYETDKTLHSELVKAMATASERFSLALKNLHEKNECPPTIGERFPFVLACAEIAVGRTLGNERCEDNTLIRSFVSYQLRKEEYGYCEIGRMLGRDHSSVIYLYNKMSDMMSVPNAYREEMEKWKEFQRLVGQPRQCSHPSSQTTSASALAESPAK